MRSIWQSLLWKEWHEHKWKLLGLLILMSAAVGIMFWQHSPTGIAYALPMVVYSTTIFYGILAGIFLGMFTAAGENSRGTMRFLQSLPVASQKPAWIRLIVSWIVVVLPIFLFVGFAHFCLYWHELGQYSLDVLTNTRFKMGLFTSLSSISWPLAMGMNGALVAMSLLLWMAATGANRSNEIRAGAIGFLSLAVVWFCLVLLLNRAERFNLTGLESVVVLFVAAAPGSAGLLDRSSFSVNFLVLIMAAILGHVGVFGWYLRRYGRKTVRPARTLGGSTKAAKNDWIAPPRRSQLTAIAWKQLSETGPLALIAAAAVIGISGFVSWVDAETENGLRSDFAELLGPVTLSVGFMVTIVAGMGVFVEDVKPQVAIFWRSRPVNTTHWFLVKFFTGLAVLAVTFGALFLLANGLTDGQFDGQFIVQEHLGKQVTLMALVYVLLYTLSMLSYCLGRQPMIAAVIAIGSFWCGAFLIGKLALDWPLVLWLLLVTQVAATALAWLAVRNNWGWDR
ncbi:MAG: hypothetical protein MI725_12935 [Pirellulales bacterium]|nr:hypothetical protein [Pirellulales bacterium]